MTGTAPALVNLLYKILYVAVNYVAVFAIHPSTNIVSEL